MLSIMSLPADQKLMEIRNFENNYKVTLFTKDHNKPMMG